jgi:hypothetical protein
MVDISPGPSRRHPSISHCNGRWTYLFGLIVKVITDISFYGILTVLEETPFRAFAGPCEVCFQGS